jgi:hypothetical protein
MLMQKLRSGSNFDRYAILAGIARGAPDPPQKNCVAAPNST